MLRLTVLTDSVRAVRAASDTLSKLGLATSPLERVAPGAKALPPKGDANCMAKGMRDGRTVSFTTAVYCEMLRASADRGALPGLARGPGGTR